MNNIFTELKRAHIVTIHGQCATENFWYDDVIYDLESGNIPDPELYDEDTVIFTTSYADSDYQYYETEFTMGQLLNAKETAEGWALDGSNVYGFDSTQVEFHVMIPIRDV